MSFFVLQPANITIIGKKRQTKRVFSHFIIIFAIQ